VDVTGLGYGLM